MKTVYIVDGPHIGQKVEVENKVVGFDLNDEHRNVRYAIYVFARQHDQFYIGISGNQPSTVGVMSVLRAAGAIK